MERGWQVQSLMMALISGLEDTHSFTLAASCGFADRHTSSSWESSISTALHMRLEGGYGTGIQKKKKKVHTGRRDTCSGGKAKLREPDLIGFLRASTRAQVLWALDGWIWPCFLLLGKIGPRLAVSMVTHTEFWPVETWVPPPLRRYTRVRKVFIPLHSNPFFPTTPWLTYYQ